MPGRLEEVPELAARYREAAAASADITNPRKQNKWADEVYRCYKRLRETEEGRSAIMALMDDPDPHVRGWSAAHGLAWNTERARKVLETLRDGGGPGSFSAKWTLIEFDRGKLTFEH